MHKSTFNFREIVTSIKSKGGLEDYPPSGLDEEEIKRIDSILRIPRFPGDFSTTTGGGIANSLRHRFKPPRPFIELALKSFRDAVKFYANSRDVFRYMCTYYQGNFLSDINYRFAAWDKMRDQRTSSYSGIDDNSIPFDDPRRKSTTRQYYSKAHYETAVQTNKDVPAIEETVIAFQSGFLSYLSNLEKAFKTDKSLAQAEKKRGILVTQRLYETFLSPNFVTELLPAMCLAYDRRDPSHTSRPKMEDFQNGYRAAITLGVFQNYFGDIHMVCPAATTLGAVSSGSAANESCARTEPNMIGSLLGKICERITSGKRPENRLASFRNDVWLMVSVSRRSILDFVGPR